MAWLVNMEDIDVTPVSVFICIEEIIIMEIHVEGRTCKSQRESNGRG
jgi:hypothetical protein